ncbi:hypothetical protein [Nocardia sp. IFM 10818]
MKKQTDVTGLLLAAFTVLFGIGLIAPAIGGTSSVAGHLGWAVILVGR